MTAAVRRYASSDEDSARWDEFEFRAGDIVISTRTKHGTTWMQMICALLVFGTPDLPAPVADLSPWLDWTTRPRAEVFALLAAQEHRRIIKTHTPLAGVPLDPSATYIVVGRHPLDAAVSLYHQQLNIDRVRWAELTGNEPPDPNAPQPSQRDSVAAWSVLDLDPYTQLDFLPGVVHHYADAWARRHDPNVVMVHYDQLQADLDGTMAHLAARLALDVDETTWPDLVGAAGFDAMRDRAEDAVPDRSGVLRSSRAFFRTGRSGGFRDVLSEAEIAQFETRLADLAPDPEFREWLLGGATR